MSTTCGAGVPNSTYTPSELYHRLPWQTDVPTSISANTKELHSWGHAHRHRNEDPDVVHTSVGAKDACAVLPPLICIVLAVRGLLGAIFSKVRWAKLKVPQMPPEVTQNDELTLNRVK